MSLQRFKDNMVGFMNNQRGVDSLETFAKKLTVEYDILIKSGFQTIHQTKLLTGNTEACENIITLALKTHLLKRSGQSTIIKDIGAGFVAYWAGSQMSTFPTPLIPAIGSIYNIACLSAVVVNPGTWNYVTPQLPTTKVSIFVDQLVLGISSHLQTVSGFYVTLSAYPGFPLIPPLPGILLWSGYTVLPATADTEQPITVVEEEPKPKPKTTEEILKEIPIDNNTVEGCVDVVTECGSIEILSDNGEDAGPQINEVKQKLIPVVNTIPIPKAEEVTRIEEVATLNVVPQSVSKEVTCGDGLPFAEPLTASDYEVQLSPNFKLADVSIKAIFPHRIKAQVGLTQDEIICNLKSLCENILEPLKRKYPRIQINSGFRGTPSLSGDKISQHQLGEAVDIQIPRMKPKKYLEVVEFIINNLPYDQIIFEHGKSIWLHISHTRQGQGRGSQLTMLNGNYETGIKCYYA